MLTNGHWKHHESLQAAGEVHACLNGIAVIPDLYHLLLLDTQIDELRARGSLAALCYKHRAWDIG